MPSGWTKELVNKRVYGLWFDMLRRCYDETQLIRGRGKTYADCTVCDSWFSLSNFYEDIRKLPGYSEWKNGGKMSIDKDLFSNGVKVYSPQTCCFVPSSVNVAEMIRRNPDITKQSIEAHKRKYKLSKGSASRTFNSEKEACEFLGVSKCSVASCYRRGCKCKGYTISRLGRAQMDGEP